MFDAGKNRMIGLPYGEKIRRYVKSFVCNTSVLRADRQTELLYQYRETRDNNTTIL